MVANSIIGSGLGIIETTSNLFIAICGPMEYAEARLCASQGFQGLGSLFSRLIASYVVAPQFNKPQDIVSLQWAYLGICFYDVLVAVALYYLPVPEAPDGDLRALGERRSEENNAPVLGIPVFLVTLILGVWSQFCYILAQECFVAGFHYFKGAVSPM
jgi:fucose permease